MSSLATAANAAATACVIVLDADPDRPNLISSVEFSYSGPGAGNLKIQATTKGTIRDLDVTLGGCFQIKFEPPLDCGQNQAVTITLGAIAAVTGKLGVVAWKME